MKLTTRLAEHSALRRGNEILNAPNQVKDAFNEVTAGEAAVAIGATVAVAVSVVLPAVAAVPVTEVCPLTPTCPETP